MTMVEYDWRRGISYAAEFGGVTIPHRIIESVSRLRILLRDISANFYSDVVLGIALVVRVDGELTQYQFEGVDRIRINRKGKYLSADIGVPESEWKRCSPQEFDVYLFDLTESALQACAERFKRDSIPFDVARMERDLAKARSRFTPIKRSEKPV